MIFMSKRVYLAIVFFIGFLSIVIGQDTNYVYVDQNWQKTKPNKAKYIFRQTKQTKGFLEELSTSKGTKIYSIECSSLNPYIENGNSLCFDERGELIEKGFFSNGCPDGIWIHFNPISKSVDSINYSDVNKIIELSKKQQCEDPFVIVEEMPTFPNNNDFNSKEIKLDFHSYLSSKKYYPEIAKKRGIKGSVYVLFVVDPEGNICDINFPKSPNSKILEYETLRLMQDLPKWNPGKQNSKTKAVRIMESINFYP